MENLFKNQEIYKLVIISLILELSFERSRDALVNCIVAKADMKLTMTRSHYIEPSTVMNLHPQGRRL